jgi:pantoate--beta-alanine ligase
VDERRLAPLLYRALRTGAAAAAGGPAQVLAAARTVLDGAVLDGAVPDEAVPDDSGLDDSGLHGTGGSSPAAAPPRVDYLALADARSFTLVRDTDNDFRGPAVLAIAARVGSTRLIDNVIVEFSPGGAVPRAPREGTERHAADD